MPLSPDVPARQLLTPDLQARIDRALPVLREHAVSVDQEGRFPREAIDALGREGLLGLCSDPAVGGLGQGPREAVELVTQLAAECGSTAMITTMHLVATRVFEAWGDDELRRGLANGSRLTTLAFSEAGSRSHFWAPVSTAVAVPEGIRLDARKSWVTSASQATDYVWSSRPVAAEGASTLWHVPADAAGLSRPGPFRGLGLRGNDSTPVTADGVVLPASHRIGNDGEGAGWMLGTVLPWFTLLISSGSVGLMRGALGRVVDHVTGSRYEHDGSVLADLPTIRANLARMHVRCEMAHTLLRDAAVAVATGREDAELRVMQVKAGTGEAALEVLDLAMRVCGGQAFRADVGVERYFRDGRAASVMAPTSDQLHDFLGKALCGRPIL